MRLLVLLSSVAVAVAGLAAPAAAAPATEVVPHVGIEVPQQVVAIAGKPTTVTATVVNAGRTAATGLVLHTSPPGTSQTVPDLAAGASITVTYSVTPDVATTVAGVASTLTVSVTAGEVTVDTAQMAVVRDTGAASLQVARIDDLTPNQNFPVAIRNTGTAPIEHFAMVFAGEQGLMPRAWEFGCNWKRDYRDELTIVTCVTNRTLAPGEAIAVPNLENEMSLQVPEDTGGKYTYAASFSVVGVSDAVVASAAPEVPGLATPNEAPADADFAGAGNIATFGVPVGATSADATVSGESIPGENGDTVTLTFWAGDVGPTAIIPPGHGWFPTVRVALPAGVEVRTADPNCAPGDDGVYTCVVTQWIRPAAVSLSQLAGFRFTVRIVDRGEGTGKVTLDAGAQDHNPANNTAKITWLKTVDHRQDNQDGGTLPITGAPAARVALGGALLLITGAVTFWAARRRRITTRA
ncbi:hypothetical protein BJ973_003407 [Actinoplanes tereljensis]|uniref:LPXTG-motif cell wall-anchored protein n=1 Tax=Paractinoplanes tereljensis TaxID=571912 RepID=A0A919TZQ4_9ACTN|nr:hypothetical protein [Actinoplanes tereljensis]GIF26137.1 hypothetical protein Ate02nite_88670 [Actinoplanes tereljensis]